METFQDLERKVRKWLAEKGHKTQHQMPDGSKMGGKIEDYILFPQSDLGDTVFYADLIKFEPYKERPERYEIRICYYTLGSKPKSKTIGTWRWGQFHPLMPSKDLIAIYKEIEKKGWLKK